LQKLRFYFAKITWQSLLYVDFSILQKLERILEKVYKKLEKEKMSEKEDLKESKEKDRDRKMFDVEDLQKCSQKQVAKMNLFILENHSKLNYLSTFEEDGILCSEYCLAVIRRDSLSRRKRK
jgi:hypothetical protein